MKIRLRSIVFVLLSLLSFISSVFAERGTGDLGVIIERATGSVQIIEHTTGSMLYRIEGLGDLSHASVVFSRDERYAYVFGRDGGLTKLDLLKGVIVNRILQAGNSIGGAISQDGRLIAVSNYAPGGVRIFDAKTLEPVAEIPALDSRGQPSKVVGLVDAPDNRFVFSLYDADAIWIADMTTPDNPVITKFNAVGHQPYDALITPDGHDYLAGLFGEDGMARVNLWHPEEGVQSILERYGRGEKKMPVYKMPHLEGWAMAGGEAFVPAVGHHEVIVIDRSTWAPVANIPVHGQPVFVMARPDGRHVWVNFAFPKNDTVQVIDTERREIIKTLKPGKGVLHMEFTPRGERVWISVRDENEIQIYDTRTLKLIKKLPARKPSGIFFTSRAHRIGL